MDTRTEDQVRLDEIRETDGTLPAFAWPGGYPIVYYTQDGLTVDAKCANDNETSDPVVAFGIYFEGPVTQCDGCYDSIESAYGDPDGVSYEE